MKLGYTLIYVDDVAATMKFYEKAFGLKSGFLHESGQYGEMVTGETKLGFVHHDTAGDHGFKYQKLSPKKNAPGLEIAFVADNVKKAFKKAVKAGAISTSKPKKKPWGQIVSYVRDCNGMLVEICSAMG
ncbi:MAG: VOC family protein [Bdellovibrionaceae bacterium]|nr:VOC family protein [Pseudobdellovibrionaceae bacterium]